MCFANAELPPAIMKVLPEKRLFLNVLLIMRSFINNFVRFFTDSKISTDHESPTPKPQK